MDHVLGIRNLLLLLLPLLFHITSTSHAQELRTCPVFALQPGKKHPTQWRQHACPAEVITYSCFWSNETRAAQVLRDTVQGPAFSPGHFFALLGGRTVVLVGDSLLMQFWQSVVCRLSSPGAKYHVAWGHVAKKARSSPWGGLHSTLELGCVDLPRSTVVCYLRYATSSKHCTARAVFF